MRRERRRAMVCLFVAVVLGVSGTALPETMGTAFTYQGRFMDNGSPASGDYDFQFKVYSGATGGSPLASAFSAENVQVDDGYFTVTIDFGTGVFEGQKRWLEIGVRPGSSTGAYSILTPRHELTPTPYAMRAENGGGGVSGGGTAGYLARFTGGSAIGNSVMFESGGKVGIGLTNPAEKLVIAGNGSAIELGAGTNKDANAGKIAYQKWSGDSLEIVGAGTTGNRKVRFYAEAGVSIDGAVVIGATVPDEKLLVCGNVKCNDVIETSDARLKTDVRSLEGVLEKLGAVRAVSFRWTEQASREVGAVGGRTQLGVLAQELEAAFPNAVSSRGRYKGVSLSGLTAVLLQSVKELKAENEALKQRVAALEKKIGS